MIDGVNTATFAIAGLCMQHSRSFEFNMSSQGMHSVLWSQESKARVIEPAFRTIRVNQSRTPVVQLLSSTYRRVPKGSSSRCQSGLREVANMTVRIVVVFYRLAVTDPFELYKGPGVEVKQPFIDYLQWKFAQ
jgi:hypothetical protein